MTEGERPLTLKSAEFRRGREEGWRELDALVSRVERRGIGTLSAEELQRLPLLYRATLSSLSVARSIALDRNLLMFLESLSLRGFLAIYGVRGSLWAAAGDFLRRGFPAAVRGAAWHSLLAFLAILAGGIAGYCLTAADETWFGRLVPPGLAGGRGPGSTRQELLEDEIFAPWPGPAQAFIVLANFLFTNNTMVGIMAFSLGIAAGLPTIALLVYQGLIFGTFLALHARRGLILDFIGWVSIHGVTEFGAIILCGAAGLLIAQHMLFPGRAARLDNLARHGGQAAQIAAGAMGMFLVAALLEGGCRQLVASTALRLAIGLGTALAWYGYFRSGSRL